MWFSRKQHGDGPKQLVDDTMAHIIYRGHILSIIPLDKINEAKLSNFLHKILVRRYACFK